jgi:hypothetical protein
MKNDGKVLFFENYYNYVTLSIDLLIVHQSTPTMIVFIKYYFTIILSTTQEKRVQKYRLTYPRNMIGTRLHKCSIALLVGVVGCLIASGLVFAKANSQGPKIKEAADTGKYVDNWQQQQPIRC